MKLLSLLALVLLTPVVHAQNDPLQFPPRATTPAPLDPVQLRKNMDSAASLSDGIKADRFDLILTADYLHFELAVYQSDPKCAPRETVELDTLKADLEAIDAVMFPSIDTTYPDLVTKASADFKKLHDKDEAIQTELRN